MDDPVFEATSNSPDCKIESYSFIGSAKGASIDTDSGKVTINTDEISDETTLQIAVKVGLQTIMTPEFKFEIFDCASSIEYVNNILVQVNSSKIEKNIIRSN